MSTFVPSHTDARTFELDLRDRPYSGRHSVVFARLDDLAPEDRMIVVCEGEPTALHSQIDAWWPGEFDWSCEDSGSPASRVQITRRR
jgi:uncharacterized protein (DUF2249 family)